MWAATKRKRSEAVDVTQEQRETKRPNAACTECRKQKIKCEINNDELPCSRCRRRGLSCVLHTARRRGPSFVPRTAQPPQPAAEHERMLLVRQHVANIHSSLQQLCQQLHIQAPVSLLSHADGASHAVNVAGSGGDDTCDVSPPASPSAAQAPIDTYLTSTQHGPSLRGASPARARIRGNERLDLISTGLLSQETAERLVSCYLLRYDRFLYGIARPYRSLDQVRRASPALLAAMCAVSALHISQQEDVFEICNKEFRAIVSASLFEKRSIEYIRALCIASFWLPDASRILISDAARRAADCRLHRHFLGLAQPSETPGTAADAGNQQEARENIRLWYLLYVCDQHLSILHNRDGILRTEKDAIEQRERFWIEHAPLLNDDVRLMSQVSLLVIMSQIKDTFGSEQSKPLPKSSSVQLMHFARELDHWFAQWSRRFLSPTSTSAAFPSPV